MSKCRLCSGSLINNARKDGDQLFLTAYHCLGGESNWIFMFNYQSPSCDSTKDGPTDMTVQGAKLLAKRQSSDFALLRILETIPESYNVHLNGWNSKDATSKNPTAIHHPAGDVKKISRLLS